MKYTEKLGLKKPEISDKFDIADFNENMDILDELEGGGGGGDTSKNVRSDTFRSIKKLTQAEYDEIETPDEAVLYVIVG